MRKCGTCSKCCEGWLTGEAHGHRFWPGRKCHFLTTEGCGIYENRPETPCRSYKCMWLGDEKFPLSADTIPEWMKPEFSNVIMSWRYSSEHDLTYVEVVEAGKTIEPDVLNWIIHYCLNNNINIKYQIKGGWNKIGNDQTFLKADSI
jgi:hypothetical protein